MGQTVYQNPEQILGWKKVLILQVGFRKN